jgi:uncharacterized protein
LESEEIFIEPSPQSGHPLLRLLSLSMFVLAGILFFNALGLALLLPFYNFNVVAVSKLLTDSEELKHAAIPLLALQGTISLGAFVIMPVLYLRWVEKRNLSSLFVSGQVPVWPLIATVLLVPAFMPFNGLFIEWNESLQLPAFLHDFEIWAQQKEDSLKELTKAITNLTNPYEFLLGVIVVAAIPALGEELVFRGIVQNKIREYSGWVHGSIWIAGFLFSAIHVQFYGLLPRMLLGVLFGYIYFWSGNLWFPVLAHFTNNFLTLTFLYLKNIQVIDFDIESTESIPLPAVAISVLLSGLFMYWLRNFFAQQNRTNFG